MVSQKQMSVKSQFFLPVFAPSPVPSSSSLRAFPFRGGHERSESHWGTWEEARQLSICVLRPHLTAFSSLSFFPLLSLSLWLFINVSLPHSLISNSGIQTHERIFPHTDFHSQTQSYEGKKKHTHTHTYKAHRQSRGRMQVCWHTHTHTQTHTNKHTHPHTSEYLNWTS